MQDDQDQLLKELGLDSLDDAQKAEAIDKISATLEERVGDRIMSQLNEDQLNSFGKFIKDDDPKGATDWIKSQVPGSEQIIQEELEKIKNEVKAGGIAALPAADDEA